MSDLPESGGLTRSGWPKFLEETHVVAYRYAFRLCGNGADAEDLIQQTFLAAWERRDQLRDPDKAQAWLLAILRHAFFRLRKKRLRERGDGAAIPAEEVADSVRGAEATEERLDVQTALATLPDEFRIPLALFYFENLSYQEIAEQLDVPIGTVMSRLARAKDRLRQVLTVELPSPENAADPDERRAGFVRRP